MLDEPPERLRDAVGHDVYRGPVERIKKADPGGITRRVRVIWVKVPKHCKGRRPPRTVDSVEVIRGIRGTIGKAGTTAGRRHPAYPPGRMATPRSRVGYRCELEVGWRRTPSA